MYTETYGGMTPPPPISFQLVGYVLILVLSNFFLFLDMGDIHVLTSGGGGHVLLLLVHYAQYCFYRRLMCRYFKCVMYYIWLGGCLCIVLLGGYAFF
jgi:hypothetical protein